MRSDELGPLHGVPVAVKDLVPTAGIRTTWGSLIFKDHVPDVDGRRRVAAAAGGCDRGRQDDGTGVRSAMPDRSTAVRTHPQCMARQSQFGRVQRRVGGCSGRGPRSHRGCN